MLDKSLTTAGGNLDRTRFQSAFAASSLKLLDHHLREAPLDGRAFQVVSTVSDFEMVALPLVEELRRRGAIVKSACFWVATRLLNDDRNSPQEIAPIKAVIRDDLVAGSYELLIAASQVGTIAELKIMAAHALYDQENADINVEAVTVISPLVHIDARRQFKDCLPERYAESFFWHARRVDPELRYDGLLLPGIGLKPFEVAGFTRMEETFKFVPNALTKSSDFQRRSNPAYTPSP